MQEQASMLLFIALLTGMVMNIEGVTLTPAYNSLHGEDVEPKRTTNSKDVTDSDTYVTIKSSFEEENSTTVDQDKMGPKQSEGYYGRNEHCCHGNMRKYDNINTMLCGTQAYNSETEICCGDIVIHKAEKNKFCCGNILFEIRGKEDQNHYKKSYHEFNNCCGIQPYKEVCCEFHSSLQNTKCFPITRSNATSYNKIEEECIKGKGPCPKSAVLTTHTLTTEVPEPTPITGISQKGECPYCGSRTVKSIQVKKTCNKKNKYYITVKKIADKGREVMMKVMFRATRYDAHIIVRIRMKFHCNCIKDNRHYVIYTNRDYSKKVQRHGRPYNCLRLNERDLILKDSKSSQRFRDRVCIPKQRKVVCGRNFYNKSTHLCCGGKIRNKKRKSDHCCHKTIYNSNTHTCCGEHVTETDIHMNCCDGKLFNTTSDICVGKEIFKRKGFCKTINSLRDGHTYTVDSHECCHNQLIDVRFHICCNGETLSTSGNNNTCCGKVLYDRTTHFCRSKKVFRKGDNGGFKMTKKMNTNITKLQNTNLFSLFAKEIEIMDKDGRDGINDKEIVASSPTTSNIGTTTCVVITLGSALVVVPLLYIAYVIRKKMQKPSTRAFKYDDNDVNAAYYNDADIEVSLSNGNTVARCQPQQCNKYSDGYSEFANNGSNNLRLAGQHETLNAHIAIPVVSDNNETFGSFVTSNSEVVIPIEENSDIQTPQLETVNTIEIVETVKEAPAPPEEDVKVCSISLLGNSVTKVVKNPSSSFSEPTFQSKTHQQVDCSNKTSTFQSDSNSDSSLYASEITLNLSEFKGVILNSGKDHEEFNIVQGNFLENLDKTFKVKDTNLTKNLFKDGETQTMPFKQINKRNSFGKPFNHNCVLSKDQRTIIMADSDVKMTLPVEDLRLNKIECFASSYSDIGAIGRKLGLSNSEKLVSPAVEYCLQGVPHLSNYAVIKMPIVGMIDNNFHAWRVVSDEGEQEISEKIEVPIVDKMNKSLDTFCIISQTKGCAYIYTKVFSWYTFTRNGQTEGRDMLMKAWLYGKMKKRAVNELSAEVCLYLLDTLYDLTDYNHVITKQNEKSGHKLLTNVRPLDMSRNVGSYDNLWLQLHTTGPWRCMFDELEPEYDASEKSVALHDIVASQTTPYPYCYVWNLETVNEESTLLKAYVYVTFKRSGTEGLSSQERSSNHKTRFDVVTELKDHESNGSKEATAKAISSSIRRLDSKMINRLTQQIIMYSGIATITSTRLDDILLELQMKQDTDTFIERIVASLHVLKLYKVIRSLNDVGIIPDNMLPVRPELEKRPPCSFDGRGNPLRNFNDQSQLSGSSESFEESCKSKQDDTMGLDKDMPHGELSKSPQCSYITASNPSSNCMNCSENERDKTSCTTTTHLVNNRVLNSNTYPRLTKQTYNSNRENTKGVATGIKDFKSENAINKIRECQRSPVFFPPHLGVLVADEGGDTTEDNDELNDNRVKRNGNEFKTEEAKTDCHIEPKVVDIQYDPSM